MLTFAGNYKENVRTGVCHFFMQVMKLLCKTIVYLPVVSTGKIPWVGHHNFSGPQIITGPAHPRHFYFVHKVMIWLPFQTKYK